MRIVGTLVALLLGAALLAWVVPQTTQISAQEESSEAQADIKQYDAPPEMAIDPSKSYTATIETSEGTMTVELFPEEAPTTVNNFVFLAREGFYESVIFHRVIPGFMIQGGDPTGTGRGGPGYRFEDEPVERAYNRGILAMANAGPNTNGSQFFIMHSDYPLPPNYTIFGQLIEGEDVLDTIATAETGPQDRPVNPVAMTNVTIEESDE